MHFEGMVLAKSPLKVSKQMGTASIALKFIIGPGVTLFDDPHPITEQTLWTMIAEGPLAHWLHQHLVTPTRILLQALLDPSLSDTYTRVKVTHITTISGNTSMNKKNNQYYRLLDTNAKPIGHPNLTLPSDNLYHY